MKKIIVVLLSVSLAGCATMQKPQMMPPPAPMHHKGKKPVVVVPPVVLPAPVVPPKKSFKDRWESRFFRDRALRK